MCVCLSAIATASVVRLPGSDHQAKYMTLSRRTV